MAVREYTVKLLNAIQDGMIDRDTVITAALNYMSEQEVKGMCGSNRFFDEEEEEDEEDDGQPDEAQEWEYFDSYC